MDNNVLLAYYLVWKFPLYFWLHLFGSLIPASQSPKKSLCVSHFFTCRKMLVIPPREDGRIK